MKQIYFLILFFSLFVGCASKSTAPGITVPALAIQFNCGKCQVRPSAAALITEGYKLTAQDNNSSISQQEKATVTILDYNARNDDARFWAGAMAGRDTIKAVVQYKKIMFDVEEHYSRASKGIDDLARKIGEIIFENFQEKLKP